MLERNLSGSVKSTRPVVRALLVSALLIAHVAAPGGAARLDGARERPQGTIAYTVGNICLVSTDGSGRRCITHTFVDYDPIVWSADGGRIAFVRIHGDEHGRRPEVVIVDRRGRQYGQLSPDKVVTSDPSWSPVAPRLAYTRASPE